MGMGLVMWVRVVLLIVVLVLVLVVVLVVLVGKRETKKKKKKKMMMMMRKKKKEKKAWTNGGILGRWGCGGGLYVGRWPWVVVMMLVMLVYW